MSLFLLLLVPVLIGLAGLIIWGKDIKWQEFLIQEIIVISFILITFFVAAYSKIADTEIWSGQITSKEKKTLQCSESYSCNCHEVCFGSGKNESCHQQCQTCHRYWSVTNWSAQSTDEGTAYSEGSCYADKPREPPRYTQIVIGEPTASTHFYKNYIKGNPDTIIRRTDVNKNFVIPKYPDIYDYYRSVRFIGVGINDSKFVDYDNKLDTLNTKLGSLKQVNIIVIVTNESDQLYTEKLRQDWLGGKKNDFIVVIGAPQYPLIQWADVVSWTDSEDAKVFTKNRILELKNFDGDKILNIISEEVQDKYKRKEMKDFEYLKARIQPSTTAKIIIAILSIGASIGLTYLFKKEDYFE